MPSLSKNKADAPSARTRDHKRVSSGSISNTTAPYTMKDVIALHKQMFEPQSSTTSVSSERAVPEQRNPADFRSEGTSQQLRHVVCVDEASREHAIGSLAQQDASSTAATETTATLHHKDDKRHIAPSTSSTISKQALPSPSENTVDAVWQENEQLQRRKYELEKVMQELTQATTSEKGQFVMDSFIFRSQIEVLAEDIDYLKRKSQYLGEELFELHLERVQDLHLQEDEETGDRTGEF